MDNWGYENPANHPIWSVHEIFIVALPYFVIVGYFLIYNFNLGEKKESRIECHLCKY